MAYRSHFARAPLARTRFTVDVRIPKHGLGDLPGLFDMMRYDAARVIDWDTTPDGMRLTLDTDKPPTVERWQSFMLHPKEV